MLESRSWPGQQLSRPGPESWTWGEGGTDGVRPITSRRPREEPQAPKETLGGSSCWQISNMAAGSLSRCDLTGMPDWPGRERSSPPAVRVDMAATPPAAPALPSGSPVPSRTQLRRRPPDPSRSTADQSAGMRRQTPSSAPRRLDGNLAVEWADVEARQESGIPPNLEAKGWPG